MKKAQKQTTTRYYKDLDISRDGRPVGIDEVAEISNNGLCYCIIEQDDTVERIDVYKDTAKIHYKKFGYDAKGRVVKNIMYTPDGTGNWHIADDIWYYVYDDVSGLRSKKVTKMPEVSQANEITYDQAGGRTGERAIIITPEQFVGFHEMA